MKIGFHKLRIVCGSMLTKYEPVASLGESVYNSFCSTRGYSVTQNPAEKLFSARPWSRVKSLEGFLGPKTAQIIKDKCKNVRRGGGQC